MEAWYLIHLPSNPGEEIRRKKGYDTDQKHPGLLAAMKEMLPTAERQVLSDVPIDLTLPALPAAP